jgi:hypothetical protein
VIIGNANKMTLAYLIGRQYIEQHKTIGRPIGSNFVKKLGQNDQITSQKIAQASNLGEKTVRRAAEFSAALDSIIKVTGIKRQAILLGNLKPLDTRTVFCIDW